MRLILASVSPRRAELLTAAGYAFDIVPVDIDEDPEAGEDALDYVRRVALDKALASRAAGPGTIVLAADTTVTIDGAILGKPADAEDARRMLRLLSGREHLVHTAVAVRGGQAPAGAPSGRAAVDVPHGRAIAGPADLRTPAGPADGPMPDVLVDAATTRVRFLRMSPAEIDWYVASGEPDGKAGAYAIQGRASRFIDWLEGSYSNVVGLPVHLVHALLSARGYGG
jgi:septum formation protein